MPPRARVRRRAASSETFQRDWRVFQESVVGRTSRYLSSVGDLLQRRSLEPKEWLGGYAKLWQEVVGDVGDWILAGAKAPLRPTDEWVRRFRTVIPRTRQTASISVEVPLNAFESSDAITLVTDGLSRGSQQVVVQPGVHIHFKRRTIARSQRRSVKIMFSNLQNLRSGTYSGMLCARETDLTVAILELTVR